MNKPTQSTGNYAGNKIASIIQANVKMFESGLLNTKLEKFQAEMERLRDMNRNLVRAKSPEKDLVNLNEYIAGIKAPEIHEDGAIKDIRPHRDL